MIDEAILFSLLGVAVGAAATLAGHWLSGRITYRREMRRIAYEAAVEEYKAHRETASKQSTGITRMPPLIHYVAFHMDLIETRMRDQDFERAFARSAERIKIITKVRADQ